MRLLAFRNIGYLVILLLILSIERVVGLPIVFWAGSLLMLTRFKLVWHRVVIGVILSWGLGVVFNLPFTLSLVLLLGSWWFFLNGHWVVKSSRFRLLMMVGLCCAIVGLFKQFSLSWLQIVISGLSMSTLLFISRAVSFGERTPSRSSLRWDKRVWQIPELIHKS